MIPFFCIVPGVVVVGKVLKQCVRQYGDRQAATKEAKYFLTAASMIYN